MDALLRYCAATKEKQSEVLQYCRLNVKIIVSLRHALTWIHPDPPLLALKEHTFNSCLHYPMFCLATACHSWSSSILIIYIQRHEDRRCVMPKAFELIFCRDSQLNAQSENLPLLPCPYDYLASLMNLMGFVCARYSRTTKAPT